MFVPNTDKYPFPLDTASHYMDANLKFNHVFDKNYPYIDKSKSFRFKRFWVRLLLRLIVFPMARIKMGIKIENKWILRQNKKLLKNGFISISNHVHRWDYICVMKAIHNIKWPYLLSWDQNINGKDGPLVRMVGGIPIPVNDNEATIEFLHQTLDMIKEGNILHIYPEGSMWEYYHKIRPFKLGAASFAIKSDKPILPMAFTYRKPGWLRRKIFKQNALFTLTIGLPLFVDNEIDKKAQLADLTTRAHQKVVELAGLSKEENLYEDIYNNSRRID